MGSHMKKSIFDEQTSKALKKWHQAVKKRHKKGSPRSLTPSTSAITSPSASPLHQFYRSRTIGNSSRSQAHSRFSYYSDTEISDQEAENLSPSSTTNLIPSFKHKDVDVEPNEYRVNVERNGDEDFSFVNAPSPQAEENGERR
ncbi:uncharacterized protein A4U43_C04F4190 [Asparagus officinalis]|uniref:MLO-like protein n=1 Tax=Asparagus officinalis TaxID=4686 RepID=A0A5P1F3L4_ASPOF|nr:uncharacterized protein A4U43_C04F4190 [Asparagus officinalis]